MSINNGTRPKKQRNEAGRCDGGGDGLHKSSSTFCREYVSDAAHNHTAVGNKSKNNVSRVTYSAQHIDRDQDDDLIVIQSGDHSPQSIDYYALKRIVTSMVTHCIEEGMENTLKVTPQYVLQRLKALYHQDFSDRLVEIKYCLQRARQRSRTHRESAQLACPGVSKSDMELLSPPGWLNDILINQYLQIVIQQDDHYDAISSFAYDELLRGKEPGLPGRWKYKKGILIPVCISHHWSLMCFRPETMNITMFNSMPITEEEIQCANLFLEFFKLKAKAKHAGVCQRASNLPRQKNEYDCGVYLCMFSRCVVNRNSFDITPAHVTEFRKLMKVEIMQNKLVNDISDQPNESDSESEEELYIESSDEDTAA